jgi:transposase
MSAKAGWDSPMESLLLSQREFDRLAILVRLSERKITTAEATAALRISQRQLRRLRRRLQTEGPAGVRSKHFGRAPNNRLDPDLAAEAIALVQLHYADFGPTFANEKLRERHGLVLSTESLRTLMRQSGLWKAKTRKRNIHQPRERRPYFGELVQIDGSRHDWFEGRAPICTLLVYVDDATSALLALQFVKSESTNTYFSLTADYLRQFGKPRAFYSDKHSIFRINQPRFKIEHQSRFARAMQELDIELICAHSPQAKGRVERANATLQRRLVRELRLNHISSMDAANAYLAHFITDYNSRFAKQPSLEGDAHRPLSSTEDLNRILAHTYDRKLSKNLTCQCDNITFHILDRSKFVLRGAHVQVRITLDGTTLVERRGKPLTFETSEREKNPPIATRKEIDQAPKLRIDHPEQARTPAPNHPWRRYQHKIPAQPA